MVARAADKGEQLTYFSGLCLVVCPRCKKQARVVHVDEVRDPAIPFEYGKSTLSCISCGHSHQVIHDPKNKPFWKEIGAGQGYGASLGQPLWLQARCCGGELLWAYNLKHLEFLRTYIAAKLRERTAFTKLGESPSYRNNTMHSRLPQWMKSAKNREEILATIELLFKRSVE